MRLIWDTYIEIICTLNLATFIMPPGLPTVHRAIRKIIERLACLLPNSPLLGLWFVRLVNLVWTICAALLVPVPFAAFPSEAFGVLVEEVIVNGTMAILVPVIPGTAIPIDFELTCIPSEFLAPLHACTVCVCVCVCCVCVCVCAVCVCVCCVCVCTHVWETHHRGIGNPPCHCR
jgi:hypothetical protein